MPEQFSYALCSAFRIPEDGAPWGGRVACTEVNVRERHYTSGIRFP